MTKSPEIMEKDIAHISKFNEVYEEELNKSEITGIRTAEITGIIRSVNDPQ